MSTLASGLFYVISCTTGFFQPTGQPVQEMCVVVVNGEFSGMYEGTCEDVGQAMYKDALKDGLSPSLTVNGYDYNRM